MNAGPDGDWAVYVATFHDQRAGITEDVLGHSLHDGLNAYQWLVQGVPVDAEVLDLACGSAPLRPLVPSAWVGIDVSMSELELARSRGRGPLVVGDAAVLPFRDGSFDAVVCSMALMLVQPLDTALAEVARVLRPGGLLTALLPGNRPLMPADVARYARLLLALRRRLRYPNDRSLGRLSSVLSRAGFVVSGDERRRFVCRVTTPEMAALCVISLYLPGQPPERTAQALAVARSWVGKALGVPLRRVTARRR